MSSNLTPSANMTLSGNSSIGRALAFQAKGCEFETRFPLKFSIYLIMSAIEIILCVIFGSFFYILLGMLMFCLLQMLIDDFFSFDFELDKYMLAICAFWPLVPLVFIVLGVIQMYQLLRLIVRESQRSSNVK